MLVSASLASLCPLRERIKYLHEPILLTLTVGFGANMFEFLGISFIGDVKFRMLVIVGT